MSASSTRTAVIIPAAGSGTRFGGDVPKQYRLLAGRTILDHVIDRFVSCDAVGAVIVAVASERVQPNRERVSFVAGGATRQQSVSNALASLDAYDLVAVHDAVRPFFRLDTFRALLDAAREHGASLPALPVTDTIHATRDGAIASTLDRSTLVAAQTPQCFRTNILREVLERAARNGDEGTDEAGLAARYGWPVRVVPGDAMNFKITRAEDLALAEAHFAEWSR